MSLTVDIPALAAEATALLAKVLVNPPTVEIRDEDFQSEHTMVGDKYLVIDGGSFEVIPVVGTRPAIGRTVEILEWDILTSTDLRTANDPFASPDVEERNASSFHEALAFVTSQWTLDQLGGHAEAMF